MSRLLLLLVVASCVCAAPIPITGSFGYSGNADFIDIFGPDFVWTFHQGDGPTHFAVCSDPANCDPSFTNSLDPDKVLGTEGFAVAVNGPYDAFLSAVGPPPTTSGMISGTIMFHIFRRDWSDLPDECRFGCGFILPIRVSGHIRAETDEGFVFINRFVNALGTLGTDVATGPDFVAFIGASGEFQGTASEIPEPATGFLLLPALLALLLLRRHARR
jgi:hypothetical protein